MKLTSTQMKILKFAVMYGTYKPVAKATIDDCNVLVGLKMLEEYDACPGRFHITTFGEQFSELLEVSK